MTGRWQAAIAYALVGVEVALDESARPDPDAAVAGLSVSGWTRERIGAHARELIAAEQPWPHPVPAELREGCGPAQLHAAVARTRELLGLVSLEVRPPSRRQRLTADEKRLLADVPPHHVR